MKKILFMFATIFVFSVRAFANNDFINAAGSGDIAKVQEYLNSGLDVNTTDDTGTTALMIAAWYGHANIVELVIEKGADGGLRDNMGRTAFMYAAASTNTNPRQAEIVFKILQTRGTDKNASDNNGYTALMHSYTYGKNEYVRDYLIYIGVNLYP